jgi:cytohesin
VNAAFPPALFAIDAWDKSVQSDGAKMNFPGRVVGYKPFIGVRKYAEFSLDPFRAWQCATIKAYGVYFGTDKLGHFTDMGKHYYRKYRDTLAEGKDAEAALKAAVGLGAEGGPLLFSESGLLGEMTAGAYSNADLVANYMGMTFYRNLTDEVSLHGVCVPPMLTMGEDGLWKITDRVRPDSDFFCWFFSDHYDEALNPSRYVKGIRDKIRQGIEDHASDTIDRYADAHGARRAPAWFSERQRDLSTYWGFDYGHRGDPGKDLLTIANTCYPAMPKDAKPDARDRTGLTPLHVAARDGDVNRVRELLEQGADANVAVRSGEPRSPAWGNTPLHYAAACGNVQIIKMLIDKGAKPPAANDRGETPLHRATQSADVVNALFAAGAKIDAADERGQTALHWAALDGTPQVVTALLAAGGSAVAKDHQGRTPLHAAARGGNVAAATALLDKQKDAATIADNFGVTPLQLAARRRADQVVALLLDRGAQPNAQDKFGMTALHDATRANAPEIVSQLLAANANPAIADLYGTTALHLAGRYGSANVARLLLDAGANASARGLRGTPIDEARRVKNRPVLALMRQAGGTEGAAQQASAVQGR